MNKKKILALVAVLLLIMILVAAVVLGKKRDQETNGEKKVYVSTETVLERDLQTVISTKGSVVAKDRVDLYAELSSNVAQILVSEGDYVTRGDVLMTLDDESLEKQIRDASLSLEISKINYNNAVTVSKDQVSITRAKNTYDTALKDYENTQVLFDSGAVSQRELDQAELAFDEAKLAYESTLNATSTTDNSLKIASLELESAENRLSDLINSREDTQIRASITGQITSLNVAQGDLVSPSIPLATIETTKALEITTYIGEYDINMVHIDQEVSISGYGVGDNVYEGRVTYIGASAQVQSVGQSTERSVLVKIDIIGDTTFKPNFTADVDIEVAKAENAKAVPYEAIDYRDGENYIFRVVEGKAQMLPVTLGVQGEIYIEVISDDLAIGDEIVLDPPSSLVEGNNIVVIEGGN